MIPLLGRPVMECRVDHLRAFGFDQIVVNTLCNLGVLEDGRRAVAVLGYDLDDVLEAEPDAALGNGGLGRLATCFLDSMATLDLPGVGYGINYEFGLFRQRFDDGWQQERPDHWMGSASPWLLERADEAVAVPLYGRIEHGEDATGLYNPLWLDWQVMIGVPYDMPIVGHGGRTVNALRLFSARASEEFDMRVFNDGDHVRAIQEKIASETIAKVLYPSDSVGQGRELRLTQEYFLVACALRDIVRGYRQSHASFDGFVDLSEQISAAGKEASGTGNMKCALNGAVTMGTLDGANVEILQEAGAENTYIFGLTVDGIDSLRRDGYDPQAWCRSHPTVGGVMDAIGRGRFSRGDATLFQPLLDRLLHQGDEYMHLADFDAYVSAQERAGRDFTDEVGWTRMAIVNTARVGFFSSDRTIAEYAHDI